MSVYLIGLSSEAADEQTPVQLESSEDAASQQQQNGSVKGPTVMLMEPQIETPTEQDSDCEYFYVSLLRA